MVNFRRLRSASPSQFRMSNWPASKPRRVLAALERIGWRVKRQRGSHQLLSRPDWPDYEFTFHNQDEDVSEDSEADRIETGRPLILTLRLSGAAVPVFEPSPLWNETMRRLISGNLHFVNARDTDKPSRVARR